MISISKTVLIVDDEPKMIEVIKSYMEHSKYVVYEARTGEEALEAFKKYQPSVIILDLMLPGLSGETVCRKIRQESEVPIIMLTAKSAEESIIEGLGIGADDYMTKPFSPRQLVARVEAVLRRSTVPNLRSLNFGNLVIEEESHNVIKEGETVNLTPKEYKLLLTLANHPKKVFTREELIELIMEDEYEGFDRIIDTHVKNLRQKIEDDTKSPKYILTVHGIGYRFGG